MDYYSMSDNAIQAEIGARLKALRLQKNRTQNDLSQAIGLSVNVIKSLEGGKGKLSSLIAVLRELGRLDGLSQFIPEQKISPIELAKREGKKRIRASGTRQKDRKREN